MTFKNQSFTLPYPTIHPAYYSACMWMDNQDLSGGGVGAGHSVFANQGNKTYYAKYSRIERCRCARFGDKKTTDSRKKKT